ncbi:PLP-dependent aminotransferase family protein [Aliikangiella coralliicola]|uniref:PLP-dependent aminotransferase family protein n=1 Tax=Aliikangiella coralliicola TaxID=2592383 RepID=A0A545UA65_9GAMM|nr:PLP-dependent aminotransferase family protein [Aliikangiella coralliicola]TQV86365.1 PLP-dependent aminotransferase family protein [Aliikangiella coralliicola]
MKLYEQIADDLRDLINQGVYHPGDKLPSIRHLSVQRKVSIATVQRALEELEVRGLIEAKPKSGCYVRMPVQQNVSYRTPLIPLVPKLIKIHEFASHIFHQCDADEVINLGTSYPASKYFPEKYIQQIASQVVKKQIDDVVEVHFSPGHPFLREILAKRLNEYGCRVKADELIVTNGCLEAMSICLRAVAKPGDTIAIESPGFVGLFQLIESLGYKALEIPCHPIDGISLEALELALEQWDIKAVAVVPTFSNPLGTNMPLENRRRLVEMLAEQSIPLIEDDLLGDLSFDGSRTKPCKAFDKKGLVLYCSSASKTVASGLRIGWIAPGAFYKEVSYFKTFTNISAPNITQIIVAEFFKSGKYDRYLRQFTSVLAQRMYQFQQLIEKFFPEDTRMSRPQGGCILWVVLPVKIDGFELFQRAISQGIAIIPGQVSSASKKFNHCIRINCACDPDVELEPVIKTLANIVNEMLASDH